MALTTTMMMTTSVGNNIYIISNNQVSYDYKDNYSEIINDFKNGKELYSSLNYRSVFCYM